MTSRSVKHFGRTRPNPPMLRTGLQFPLNGLLQERNQREHDEIGNIRKHACILLYKYLLMIWTSVPPVHTPEWISKKLAGSRRPPTNCCGDSRQPPPSWGMEMQHTCPECKQIHIKTLARLHILPTFSYSVTFLLELFIPQNPQPRFGQRGVIWGG